MEANSLRLQLVLPSAFSCVQESSRARAAPLYLAVRPNLLLTWAVLATGSLRRDQHTNGELRAPSCKITSADARLGSRNRFLAFITLSANLAAPCSQQGPIMQMCL